MNETAGWQLRYMLSRDKLFDVDPIAIDPESGELDGSSPILYNEQGARYNSALGYTYAYDSRLTGPGPTDIVETALRPEFLGSGGDVQAVTTTALAGIESRAWREEVALRAEVEGGAIHTLNDDGGITERFSGNGKVRGFAPNGYGPRDLEAPNEDMLGGNFYWAARAEAQFPVGLPEEFGITGGLFADVGSVWGLDDTVGANGVEVDDSMRIRSSVGASCSGQHRSARCASTMRCRCRKKTMTRCSGSI